MRVSHQSILHRVGLLAGILTCALAGCTAVGVRHADRPTLSRDICSGITDNGELSPWTTETLHRYDLLERYRRAPAITLARLQAITKERGETETVFAMAEVPYAWGRSADLAQDKSASHYYYLSAGYAYHYLFDDFAPDLFEPRFRLACDFYNAAVEQCLRTALRAGG